MQLTLTVQVSHGNTTLTLADKVTFNSDDTPTITNIDPDNAGTGGGKSVSMTTVTIFLSAKGSRPKLYVCDTTLTRSKTSFAPFLILLSSDHDYWNWFYCHQE